MTDAVVGRDRTRRLTLYLAALILPFLAVASVLLLVFPAATDVLFAWTIQPPLSAMFLGSAYVGGIWYFITVLRQEDHWHRIAYGMPAVVVFATLLGIASFLHIDRFHFDRLPAWVWFALYVTTPFAVLVAWLRNRRADPRVPDRPDVAIPRAVRGIAVAVGGLALACGLTMVFAPTLFLETWAWQLTPLTARVTGAILTLPGVVNLWLLRDDRWSAFRWMVHCEIASLLSIMVSIAVCNSQIEWDRPAAPVFVAGIVASLVAFVVWVWYCDTALHRAWADIVSPV
jgi:hypothetical protein